MTAVAATPTVRIMVRGLEALDMVLEALSIDRRTSEKGARFGASYPEKGALVRAW